MDDKKDLAKLAFPADINYHPEHTWAKVSGAEFVIGITDFAQDQLGEIAYIELPNVGDAFDQGEVIGQAESVKSVSALYMPVSGEVTAVNGKLADSPGTVNKDPFGAGWMIAVKPKDLSGLNRLLTKDQYITYLNES